MTKKVDKAGKIKKGPPTRQRSLHIPQECIDLILNGIAAIKTSSQISREIADKYDISIHTAQKRVQSVWRALEKEAKMDSKLTRQKVSAAILNIYREAVQDMNLDRCLEIMDEHNIPTDQRWRILSKWDPYKGANLALKALDQYTKLHGAAAPEQLEVKSTHEIVNPLLMTPQEKRKRIQELLVKRELQGPTGKETPSIDDDAPPKVIN